MQDWIVPVIWEACGFIKVKAETAMEACQKVHDNPGDYPLPYQSEYVDASFNISGDVEEAAAMSEIFTDYESGKWGQYMIFKEEDKMSRTLQDVLDHELSPDNMGNYTPNELADFLVKNDIVSNTADVNRIVIEGIQKAVREDDEFPIKYYSKDEPMSEAGKATNPGECLTDEYIANNMAK